MDSMQQFESGASSKQQPPPGKALRFVTNYGAPHPKRRRIGAACLTCRKRKTACSGERPFCETCKQNKLECAGYSSESATPANTNKRTASDAGLKQSSEQDGSVKRSQPTKKASDTSNKSNAGVIELQRTSSGELSPHQTMEGKGQMTAISRGDDAGPESLFSGPRNRMPYFRWLGPTAIMPGFKQMVVKVKRQDGDAARSSTDSLSSPSLNNLQPNDPKASTGYTNTPTAVESDVRTPLSLPFYDTSAVPPSELITHLANTFFIHLGCNYPFLQRDRFLRDLEEKQVDAILVDAVCALAARFSTHPLLTQGSVEGENKPGPADYGHAFAQRAKQALIDTYACPSVAAAQAALLLAYNEFGEQRDSGLWMYVGISIRLAEDLGLHKLEGLRYVGMDGPTPRVVKRQSQSGDSSGAVPTLASLKSSKKAKRARDEKPQDDPKTMDEIRAVEQERVDTLWAIFLLDRYVSSGTGRSNTLRDKDIELSFPSLSQSSGDAEWPAPFPALIRIVHLYGRVTDLLNSIKEPSDITAETPKRLATMESQVTNFYQGLSPRLHFDAMSFQHYMKAGEGTNFVLLHFWFHTLIILLHQPTLFKTFEGRMLQLFPNSQQLSMSSAKTIADILSYSQLIDAKASLGNPFTTQPIYIAACAFLKETAEQTASSNSASRAETPSRKMDSASEQSGSANGASAQAARKTSVSHITTDSSSTGRSTAGSTPDQKSRMAKHTLLATAASQHYQLCYKALQSLERYWAGTKYILTILDQKYQGVVDPLLYTSEEAESSMEQPKPEPAFTSPGWRRKLSWSLYNAQTNMDSIPAPMWPPKGLGPVPGSPRGVDASKGVSPGDSKQVPNAATDRRYSAIGWTLTGTMNSPSTNLAWHFAGGGNQNPNIDPRLSSMNPSEYEAATGQVQNAQYPKHLRSGSSGSQRKNVKDQLGRQAMQNYASGGSAIASTEPENVLARGSPYSQPTSHQSPANIPASGPFGNSMAPHMASASGGAHMNGNMGPPFAGQTPFLGGQPNGLPMNFLPGDVMIEQQDVDMSMLGLDMMPWFDSFPTHDMMGFDPNGHAAGGAENFGNRQAHQ